MNRQSGIDAATAILSSVGVDYTQYYVAMGGTIEQDEILLTGAEAQSLMKISKRALATLVRNQDIRVIKLSERNYRYSKAQIIDFLNLKVTK